MKRVNLFAGIFLAFILTANVLSAAEKTPAKTFSQMPENVKAIVDKSCFGCHNTESMNDKAKEKLEFNALDSLSTVKKLATLNHIGETLEKSEMPPQKFLERFPDRALSEDEVKILTEWVKAETTSLMGN